MNNTRRQIVTAAGAAATLGPWVHGSVNAQAHKGPIVIGAAQPATGVFSFAGVAMNQGLGDIVAWKNARGGVMKRELRYVWEDSGFKLTRAWPFSRRSPPPKSPASSMATARSGPRPWRVTRSTAAR